MGIAAADTANAQCGAGLYSCTYPNHEDGQSCLLNKPCSESKTCPSGPVTITGKCTSQNHCEAPASICGQAVSNSPAGQNAASGASQATAPIQSTPTGGSDINASVSYETGSSNVLLDQTGSTNNTGGTAASGNAGTPSTPAWNDLGLPGIEPVDTGNLGAPANTGSQLNAGLSNDIQTPTPDSGGSSAPSSPENAASGIGSGTGENAPSTFSTPAPAPSATPSSSGWVSWTEGALQSAGNAVTNAFNDVGKEIGVIGADTGIGSGPGTIDPDVVNDATRSQVASLLKDQAASLDTQITQNQVTVQAMQYSIDNPSSAIAQYAGTDPNSLQNAIDDTNQRIGYLQDQLTKVNAAADSLSSGGPLTADAQNLVAQVQTGQGGAATLLQTTSQSLASSASVDFGAAKQDFSQGGVSGVAAAAWDATKGAANSMASHLVADVNNVGAGLGVAGFNQDANGVVAAFADPTKQTVQTLTSAAELGVTASGISDVGSLAFNGGRSLVSGFGAAEDISAGWAASTEAPSIANDALVLNAVKGSDGIYSIPEASSAETSVGSSVATVAQSSAEPVAGNAAVQTGESIAPAELPQTTAISEQAAAQPIAAGNPGAPTAAANTGVSANDAGTQAVQNALFGQPAIANSNPLSNLNEWSGWMSADSGKTLGSIESNAGIAETSGTAEASIPSPAPEASRASTEGTQAVANELSNTGVNDNLTSADRASAAGTQAVENALSPQPTGNPNILPSSLSQITWRDVAGGAGIAGGLAGGVTAYSGVTKINTPEDLTIELQPQTVAEENTPKPTPTPTPTPTPEPTPAQTTDSSANTAENQLHAGVSNLTAAQTSPSASPSPAPAASAAQPTAAQSQNEIAPTAAQAAAPAQTAPSQSASTPPAAWSATASIPAPVAAPSTPQQPAALVHAPQPLTVSASATGAGSAAAAPAASSGAAAPSALPTAPATTVVQGQATMSTGDASKLFGEIYAASPELQAVSNIAAAGSSNITEAQLQTLSQNLSASLQQSVGAKIVVVGNTAETPLGSALDAISDPPSTRSYVNPTTNEYNQYAALDPKTGTIYVRQGVLSAPAAALSNLQGVIEQAYLGKVFGGQSAVPAVAGDASQAPQPAQQSFQKYVAANANAENPVSSTFAQRMQSIVAGTDIALTTPVIPDTSKTAVAEKTPPAASPANSAAALTLPPGSSRNIAEVRGAALIAANANAAQSVYQQVQKQGIGQGDILLNSQNYAKAWKSTIEATMQALATQGILNPQLDVSTVLAIARREQGIPGSVQVSSTGVRGPMQVTTATAFQTLGAGGFTTSEGVKNAADFAENNLMGSVITGTILMNQLLNENGGNIAVAAQIYNSGSATSCVGGDCNYGAKAAQDVSVMRAALASGSGNAGAIAGNLGGLTADRNTSAYAHNALASILTGSLIQLAPLEAKDITIVGDSIGQGTSGCASAVGAACTGTTFGGNAVSGASIAAMVAQINALPNGAKVAIVAGTNDYLSTSAKVAADAQSVIDAAKARGVQIVAWAGASSYAQDPAHQNGFNMVNTALQPVLEKAGIPYVNLQSTNLDQYRSTYHFTAAGYQAIGQMVLAAANANLGITPTAPAGGWAGTAATPTIAAGAAGYVPGIARVSALPAGTSQGYYQDPQTGAIGQCASGMSSADCLQAAREDAAMERLAQTGQLPTGAHFASFNTVLNADGTYNIVDSKGNVVAHSIALQAGPSNSDGTIRLLADANGVPLGLGGKALSDNGTPLLISSDATLPKATTNANGVIQFTDDRPVQPKVNPNPPATLAPAPKASNISITPAKESFGAQVLQTGESLLTGLLKGIAALLQQHAAQQAAKSQLPAPTVTLTADPQDVPVGTTTVLVWSSSNTSACEVFDQSGRPIDTTNRTNGATSTFPLTARTTMFMIGCQGTNGSTVQSDASVSTY